jgi:hypothetical protein
MASDRNIFEVILAIKVQLSKGFKDIKTRLADVKEETQRVQPGLKGTKRALDDIGKSRAPKTLDDLRKAFEDTGEQLDETVTEFKDIKRAQDAAAASQKKLTDRQRNANDTMGRLGSQIRNLVAAYLSFRGVQQLARQFTETTEAIDQMNKVAIQTGFTVQRISELKFAAEQNKTSFSALEISINNFSRNLFDFRKDMGEAKEALLELGFSIEDFSGLSTEESFNKVAAAISNIEDAGKRTAIAMRIFGEGGREIVPLLGELARAGNEWEAEAKRLGITISEDTARKVEEFEEKMAQLRGQMLGFKAELAGQVLPVITDLATKFGEWLAVVIEALKNDPQLRKDLHDIAVEAGRLAEETAKLVGLFDDLRITLDSVPWVQFNKGLGDALKLHQDEGASSAVEHLINTWRKYSPLAVALKAVGVDIAAGLKEQELAAFQYAEDVERLNAALAKANEASVTLPQPSQGLTAEQLKKLQEEREEWEKILETVLGFRTLLARQVDLVPDFLETKFAEPQNLEEFRDRRRQELKDLQDFDKQNPLIDADIDPEKFKEVADNLKDVKTEADRARDSIGNRLTGAMEDFFVRGKSATESLAMLFRGLALQISSIAIKMAAMRLAAFALPGIGGFLGGLFERGGTVPMMAHGGAIRGPHKAQTGVSILGPKGPDRVPILASGGEVVLPTIGGLDPAKIVSSLARLTEMMEKDRSPGGVREGGQTIILQSFDNVDAMRTGIRHGLINSELALALEMDQ